MPNLIERVSSFPIVELVRSATDIGELSLLQTFPDWHLYCRTVELANNGPSNNVMNDTLFYLDFRKPSVTQPVGRAGPEGSKFVQVEVTEVLNPKKYPLTFEVRYQSKDKAQTYLGSFSLYPADKPGKFIVATQGKVKDEGAIILSLVVPEKVETGDTIKVTVKKMKFLKG